MTSPSITRAEGAGGPATGAAQSRRAPSAATVGATLAVWTPMLLWFAAFRPGIMSADSLQHWLEATEGGVTDLHIPAYTGLMWVSATLIGSPSLLTLGQSLFLAASIVAVAKALVRLGAPRNAVMVVAGLVAATPMVGAFSVSLWKDIPYTACLLFAGARLLDVASARIRGDEATARGRLVASTAWLAPAVVLRQNGILFAVVLLAAVFVLAAPLRRLAAVLAVALVALVIVTKTVVYPVLGIEPGPKWASVATFVHDVAAVATDEPESFDGDDREVLALVAPFEHWTAVFPRFGCTSLNWIYDPGFLRERFEDNSGRFIGLWLETLAEEPGGVVRNRLCASSLAWRPDSAGTLYTVSRGVDANDLGLETVPVVQGANSVALDVLDFTEKPSVQWLLWRAPLWIYLAYLVVGLIGRRRAGNALLFAVVPLVAQQVAVMVLNPAQDARYMMFALVFSPMLLPLAAVERRRVVESASFRAPDDATSEPVPAPASLLATDGGLPAAAAVDAT